MKDYLSERPNVVQAPPAQLNAKLAALAQVFDEAWLMKPAGTHPLQLLWQRKTDALATNELLNFGDAVEQLHQEDPSWLKGQVRAIKTGDVGQSAGAIFEILALNLFSRQFCKVIPAPGSKPGFDGTLVLKDDSRVLVSVKNHGLSTREQDFLVEAKSIDKEFQSQLAVHGLRNLSLDILARDYLDQSAFKALKADVADCLADWKAGNSGKKLDRPYSIFIKDMADHYGTLSSFGVSSICRVMSPPSRNEQANFEEAIRKGCDNLYRQTKHETGDVCRTIILRLSHTASIAKCNDWAKWFFEEYPDDPVDVIILYQPTVTTDLAADASFITHHVSTILGPKFPSWQHKGNGSVRRLPTMSFLVGVISDDQPRLLLSGDGLNGVDMSGWYIYQRGDVYQKVEIVNGAAATLSNPVGGVILHTILEQNGAYRMTLSPKMDREKILLLLP